MHNKKTCSDEVIFESYYALKLNALYILDKVQLFSELIDNSVTFANTVNALRHDS